MEFTMNIGAVVVNDGKLNDLTVKVTYSVEEMIELLRVYPEIAKAVLKAIKQ